LSYGTSGDHHAIGWQAGSHNLIERNYIHNGGGPMIAFWIGGDYEQSYNTIRYNFIVDNPKISDADRHWSKSAISYGSASGANPDKWHSNLIHHNIVVNAGSRAIYTKTAQNAQGVLASGIYNNTVCLTHGEVRNGNAFESAWSAVFDMANNVSLNNAGHHVFLNYNESVAPDYSLIRIDHNLYWNMGRTSTYAWKNRVFNDLSGWQSDTQTDGTPYDVNSRQEDPLFLNASGTMHQKVDFTPRWDSPLIDNGTAGTRGLTADRDILGNPIYGTPDIGAIEYQPPYAMGVDPIDAGANVRVYGNGRFRDTAAPSGLRSRLSLQPEEGFPAQDYREWMNIRIAVWHTGSPVHLAWSEATPIATLANTRHRVGGLQANQSYAVKTGANPDLLTLLGHFAADAEGVITFGYAGHYTSTVYFEVRANNNSDPELQSPPTAQPNPATVGESVLFQVFASDPDGDNLACDWDFGDGTTGAGTSPTHVYLNAGSCTATVVVTDGKGGSATAALQIEVFANNGAGDLNGDGLVNIDDLAQVVMHFGMRDTDTGWNPLADANRDGLINQDDLDAVLRNFGRTYP
jgi:hypothetical protein